MNLHEIYSKQFMTEGMVEPNTMMSVNNLVARMGAKPNTFELMVITRMLQMIQDGTFYKEPNPWQSNLSTSKMIMDILRSLPAEKLYPIALKVQQMLITKDEDSLNKYCNQGMGPVDWMNYFTAREATD